MTEKKVFDLLALDTRKGANEGFTVDIYHPGTNEDLGITITVLGKDSDKFQEISQKQNKKRIDRMRKGGFRSANISPEEIEREGLELLAECTLKWSGVVIDGEKILCTKDNAIMVYERFPWIKEQIDTAIGDRANFIKN